MGVGMKSSRCLHLASLLILLSGCGGGGESNSGEDGNSGTSVKTGIFLDSAVEGIKYKSGRFSGITDKNGKFNYNEGDNIEFHVGDVLIGQCIAKDIITPLDLVESNNNIYNDNVINISKFLQTLDKDENNDNGISISEETSNKLINESIDFSDSERVESVLSEISSNTIVSDVKAASHLVKNIKTNSSKEYVFVESASLEFNDLTDDKQDLYISQLLLMVDESIFTDDSIKGIVEDFNSALSEHIEESNPSITVEDLTLDVILETGEVSSLSGYSAIKTILTSIRNGSSYAQATQRATNMFKMQFDSQYSLPDVSKSILSGIAVSFVLKNIFPSQAQTSLGFDIGLGVTGIATNVTLSKLLGSTFKHIAGRVGGVVVGVAGYPESVGQGFRTGLMKLDNKILFYPEVYDTQLSIQVIINEIIDERTTLARATSDFNLIKNEITTFYSDLLENELISLSQYQEYHSLLSEFFVYIDNKYLKNLMKAPEVSITNPASGSTFTTEQWIDFESVASDADGTISTYSWEIRGEEFNKDLQVLNREQNTTHKISIPDTYTLVLTVTDNDGATKKDSISIIVVKAPIDLTGSWTGAADYAPDVTANLTQSGSKLSGTINVGLKCFQSGTVAGTIDGKSINMGVTSSDNSVMEYSGTIENSDSMSGTWSQISGTCPVPNGNWTLSR